MPGAQEIWKLLETVPDPEIPALSVVDLGIVRDVRVEGTRALITITPTYSGCPAMKMIEETIAEACRSAGWSAEVRREIAPAWSTAWITERGREKLKESGIAPPSEAQTVTLELPTPTIACPHCGGIDTETISAFGSTACKALYRCRACGSPFDYFKPL